MPSKASGASIPAGGAPPPPPNTITAFTVNSANINAGDTLTFTVAHSGSTPQTINITDGANTFSGTGNSPVAIVTSNTNITGAITYTATLGTSSAIVNV